MPERTQAFVVLPGEGSTMRGPVGGPLTIKATGDDTSGSFFLFENVVQPGEGPPLHLHLDTDESWYVVEGQLRFKLDDAIQSVPAESFVFVPRGTRHCFQNVGTGPARILVMFTPAAMENFFRAHASLPPGQVDLETFRQLGLAHGMEVVGLPLAVSDPI